MVLDLKEYVVSEPDVIISKKDNVYLKIDTSEHILREIWQNYSYLLPEAKHMTRNKKFWDGHIRLFNLKTKQLYCGLLMDLIKFLRSKGYKVELSNEASQLLKRDIDMNCKWEDSTSDSYYEYFKNFCLTRSFYDGTKLYSNEEGRRKGTLGPKLIPREDQIRLAYEMITKKRCCVVSPTGSGKTLIAYLMMVFWRYGSTLPSEMAYKSILYIVPTRGLVKQTAQDFNGYGGYKNFPASTIVTDGKIIFHDITITTWQGLAKEPDSFFDQFSMIICDETHSLKATTLKKIFEKCKHIEYRYGMTATLHNNPCHDNVIIGLTGPVVRTTTTKELQDKDILSELEINCIVLDHPQSDKTQRQYQKEIEFLINNTRRNKFICKLALNLEKNTLVLFNHVEDHGKVLFDLIQETIDSNNLNKKVIYVSGETNVGDRDIAREIMETNKDNVILVASLGTFSTGINIRNLHNIILTHTTKAPIRLLQTIGRELRTHHSKDKAIFYDISDDLSVPRFKNYALRHLEERKKIYDKEQFKHTTHVLDFSNKDKGAA